MTVTVTHIDPSNIAITASAPVYLGPNVTITNTTAGVNVGNLPITTTSTLTATGMNIMMDGSTNLVIESDGDIHTLGNVFIKQNLTVDSAGSFGTLSVNGATNTGPLTVTGVASVSGTATVGNLTTAGTIHSDLAATFGTTAVVTGLATVGSLSTAGTAATGALTVTGAATVSTTLGVTGLATVGSLSSGTAATGALTVTGTASVTSTLNVTGTATAGNLTTAGITSTGSLTTGDATASGILNVGSGKFYVDPSTSAITSTSANAPIFTNVANSAYTPNDNSKKLTTQNYVDTQINVQTARINLITGGTDDAGDTFAKVYEMVNALAGSDVLNTLTATNATVGQITESVSDTIHQAYNPILVNCTPSVWESSYAATNNISAQPVPIPSSISNMQLDGWYFRNYSASEKICWMVPASSGMIVENINNLFLHIYAKSDLSLPRISLYTDPTGNTGYSGTGQYVRTDYSFTASSSSSSANKSYCLYTGSTAPKNQYIATNLQVGTTTHGIYANSDNALQTESFGGTYVADSNPVLAIAITTNSAASVNNVEFVVHSLNVTQIKTDASPTSCFNGTTKFMYQNSSVATNFLYNYFFRQNMDFSKFANPNANELTYGNEFTNVVALSPEAARTLSAHA